MCQDDESGDEAGEGKGVYGSFCPMGDRQSGDMTKSRWTRKLLREILKVLITRKTNSSNCVW